MQIQDKLLAKVDSPWRRSFSAVDALILWAFVVHGLTKTIDKEGKNILKIFFMLDNEVPESLILSIIYLNKQSFLDRSLNSSSELPSASIQKISPIYAALERK